MYHYLIEFPWDEAPDTIKLTHESCFDLQQLEAMILEIAPDAAMCTGRPDYLDDDFQAGIQSLLCERFGFQTVEYQAIATLSPSYDYDKTDTKWPENSFEERFRKRLHEQGVFSVENEGRRILQYHIQRVAERLKWKVNDRVAEVIAQGLVRNRQKYEKLLCPCGIYPPKPWNLKTVNEILSHECPCENSHTDVPEKGRCHCGLFLRDVTA